MSPFLKKSFRIGILVAVTLAVQQLYFLTPFDFTDYANAKLKESRLPISIQTAGYSFPSSLKVTGLGALIPASPLPLQFKIDSGDFGVSLSALFRALLRLEGSGELYGGKFVGNVGRSIFGSGEHGAIKLSDIKLSLHPIASIFGISGTLSGELSGDVSGVQGEIRLREGAIVGGSKIYGLFSLPKVSNGEIVLNGSVSEGRVSLPVVRFTSSLGELSANCSGELPRKLEKLHCSGSVNLSEIGERELGGYFSLLSGKQEKGRRWNVTVVAQGGRITEARATLASDASSVEPSIVK